MPQTKNQERLFALLAVLFTVPCFVIYCMSIEAGSLFAIDLKLALISLPIEWVLAYLSARVIGQFAPKLAMKIVDPKENSPRAVQTAVICCTACMMCPWMTFLATILYSCIIPALTLGELSMTPAIFAHNFLTGIAHNLPFALIIELFFVQPLARHLFGKIMARRAMAVEVVED